MESQVLSEKSFIQKKKLQILLGLIRILNTLYVQEFLAILYNENIQYGTTLYLKSIRRTRNVERIVLILDGSSLIDAIVCGKIANLICSRQLFRSTAVAN